MRLSRLSALDEAFLTLESPQAPMHVGWAALCSPPRHGSPPSFEGAYLRMQTGSCAESTRRSTSCSSFSERPGTDRRDALEQRRIHVVENVGASRHPTAGGLVGK